MDMDIKKRNNFMEMMRGVAKRYDCSIDFDLNDNLNYMKIYISDRFSHKSFVLYWDRFKSQTEAATFVWAEFFVPKRNDLPNDYIRNDVSSTYDLYSRMADCTKSTYRPSIKNVIFNGPATIVMWKDGTKTVVQCRGDDVYDPEKGLAMAISKKVFGNNYSYYKTFKKWLPKENDKPKAQTVIGAVREVNISDDGLFASVGLDPSLIGDKLTEAIKKATTSTMSISFEAKKESD